MTRTARLLALAIVLATFVVSPTAAALEAELHGTLVVLSGDPRPGAGGEARVIWGIVEGDGAFTALGDSPALRAAGAVAGERVVARGRWHDEAFVAGAITPDVATSGARNAGATGERRWLNVLCRFGDMTAVTPHEPAWFDDLFGDSAPRVGDWYRDTSYGALTIDADTTGWYDLPAPRSTYVIPYDDGSFGFDQERATLDCTAAADAAVDYNGYDGINLMFNGELNGYAWGGSWSLELDGANRLFGITWLPTWGYDEQYIVGHEMGHAMGLPHSSGPYDTPYDSMWDTMSLGGTCNPPGEWGCVGVHYIAWHKQQLGWLPAERVALAGRAGTWQVELAALARPDAPGDLLLSVPIQGSPDHVYTVEARLPVGYDARIPGAGVLIHDVDRGRWDRIAQVVDPDGNRDPNDDAARWLPGETFHDAHNGITIHVDRQTESGFVVTVTTTSAFDRTWSRTDQPIATSEVTRTWMWGPQPFAGPLSENYWDSPGGRRTVIYFDKSRMEINDPNGDPHSIWYVTNGLLVVELITGMMQMSDSYSERYEPAEVNLAGDPDDPDAPTYASFLGLLDVTADGPETAIARVVRRDGSVDEDAALAGWDAGASTWVPETRHWVADAFWAFMNARGTVFEDGAYVDAQLFENPFYATGYPITDAYWARVAVGGIDRDVLVQCFERRCLTWTPENPAEWRVEAGNVGQHYFRWRHAALPGEAVD